MKFNRKTPTTKTHNLAGGQAHAQSPKLELVSILLTSFVKNQFYRGADETVERVKELISQLKDKSFAAKAAIYARTKFGMRSISHVVAGELFREQQVTGQPWVKQFINQVVYRPDDAMEIMAYFKNNVMTKTIPNQLRKGLAAALTKFNQYELGKYRGKNKEFKLVDIVNLVHPKPTDAIDKLVEGTLKSTETWEAKLSEAGQVAESEEEKEALKATAWADLIINRKIGYFALLRNLRNIIEQAPEVLDEALELLVDEKLIKKSLVLPFRYLTAIEEIQKMRGNNGKVLKAINEAIDIATKNVPSFPGKTAIVLDESGSMAGKPHEIGSLFSAILFKANPDATVFKFANTCGYISRLNPADSVLTLAQQIGRNFGLGGGTNFHCIFPELQRAPEAFERVIILSDMQGWIGYDTPKSEYASYCKTKGASRVYSFDLQGYGTLQFPENNVYCIAGYSEKVFDLMKMLEEDRNAMVNEIEKIEFTPLVKSVRKVRKTIKKTKKPTRK